MMKITLENIDDVILEYETFFGKDFIEQAKKYTTIELKKYEIEKKEANAHPLFKLWEFLEKDISNSKQNNKLIFSPSSVFLLDLLSNLLDINKVKNIERIISALKNKATFYSAAFEAYVCALYSQYNIEIVKEISEKTPDFIIRTPKGIVQIECKSLFDRKMYEGNILAQITENITKILKRNKRSFYVYIELDKTSDIDKWKNLADVINNLSKNNIQTDTYYKELKAHIKLQKMFNWNEIIPGDLKLDYRKDITWSVGFEAIKSPLNGTQRRNLTAVGIKKELDLDFNNSIFSNFKRARKQFKKEYPSIIHIQVPIRNQFEFTEFADKYYNTILKQFERDNKKICSVVISTTLGYDAYTSPHRELLVFPNYEIYNKLPDDFIIPGTGNINIKTLGEYNSSGKLQIIFTVQNYWQEIPIGTLTNICNKNGTMQFKLIKSPDNKCRIEVIGIKKKRIYLENINPNIKKGISQKLDLIWNTNEIKLLLDGQVIANKKI